MYHLCLTDPHELWIQTEFFVFRLIDDALQGGLNLSTSNCPWIAYGAYKRLDLLEEKCRLLEQRGGPISTSVFYYIIRGYVECNRIDNAQEWFERFLEHPFQNAFLNKNVYVAFARGLVEAGQMESAEDIISMFLPRAGLLPDTGTYNEAIIEPLINLRYYDNAIDFCTKLREHPLMPNPTWRTKYLYAVALMHAKETDKAFALAYEILVSAPLEMGFQLQITMLYYTFRSKGLQAGLDLHDKLLSLPSPWTILGVIASIRLFVHRDQFRDACILFAEILDKTQHHASDNVEIALQFLLAYDKIDIGSLAIILKSVEKYPRLMSKCFSSFQAKGLRLGRSQNSSLSPVSPSAEEVDSIFNVLVNQFQSDAEFDSSMYAASKGLFVMAKSTGTLPSKDLVMSIYSLLLRKKRLDEARLWAHDLLAAGIQDPKLEILDLNALVAERSARIIGLCHNRGIADANALFDRTVGEDMMPNISAWSILLGANFAEGYNDRAFQMMIDSLASYPRPESKTQIYEAALSGIGRSGDAKTALVIVKQMSEVLNTAPRNVVILKILAGLSRKGTISAENMAAAEELFSYITMDSVQPEVFYPIKIKIYEHAGRLEDALDTFESAVAQNMAMSRSFITEMARICFLVADPSRIGMVLTVHQRQYGTDGLSPILAQALNFHYCKTKDLKALKELGKAMDAANQREYICYKQLLLGLCTLDSNMDAARYYYSKAQEAGIAASYPDLIVEMIKGYARQKDVESIEEIRKLFGNMRAYRHPLLLGDLEMIMKIMIRERGSPAHAEVVKNLVRQSKIGRKLSKNTTNSYQSSCLCFHTDWSSTRIENMLLKAYLDDGKIMIAKRLFKELLPAMGPHVSATPCRNKETYRIMIEGLRKQGKSCLAEEYVKLMKKDDIQLIPM